jgi:hypothetical protein
MPMNMVHSNMTMHGNMHMAVSGPNNNMMISGNAAALNNMNMSNMEYKMKHNNSNQSI